MSTHRARATASPTAMGRRHGLSSADDDATGPTITDDALGTGYTVKADAEQRASALTASERLQYEATRIGRYWYPIRVEERTTPAKQRFAARLAKIMTPEQKRVADRAVRQAVAGRLR